MQTQRIQAFAFFFESDCYGGRHQPTNFQENKAKLKRYEEASRHVVFFGWPPIHHFIKILRALTKTTQHTITKRTTMLSRKLVTTVGQRRLISRAVRAKSTQVESTSATPIGADGRHEVWREGIYDHDNEPK